MSTTIRNFGEVTSYDTRRSISRIERHHKRLILSVPYGTYEMVIEAWNRRYGNGMDKREG